MKNKKNIEKKEPGKIKSNLSSYVMICRLTMSFVAFLLISSSLFFILHIIGNFQSFNDRGQILILTVTMALSIIMVISSVCGIIENIFFLFLKVRIHHRIICIVVFFLAIIIGIVFIVYTSILKHLSGGLV